MVTPVAMEPLLGYHPCSTGFLTSSRNPAGGQCQVGSLTGAVASERVSEALKGSLRMVGNHSKSAKAEGSLTATPTGGAGTKVGLSSRSQGLGCSPIKAVRELGSERRETVRSLSGVGVGYLRGADLSTRGPGWTDLWCTGCHANGTAG